MKALKKAAINCLAALLLLVGCKTDSTNTDTEGENTMSVIKITSANFEEKVLDSDKPVLLDFYADWCGPCKMLAPIIEEIAKEHPEYAIGKVNVDNEPSLAQQFGIVSIPALFVIKNGEVTAQSLGYKQKDAVLALFN